MATAQPILLKLLRKKKEIGETQDKHRDKHPPLSHFSENGATGDVIDKVVNRAFPHPEAQ